MNFSPYFANKIARWMAGNAMPSAPSAIYIGLWNGNPLSGGTEVGGTITGAAARIAPTLNTVANDGSANVLSASADANFGASVAGADQTVSYLTLHDAVSAGNILGVKALAAARTVSLGDNVKVLAADWSFTVLKAS
jgi:hypothetical protein